MTRSPSIPFGRPSITDREREAVAAVLDGPILTHGPQCAAFERTFAAYLGGGAHCVSMSSCMAALHVAWFHLGIGPGDEVICPAMTHVATAHAIELMGARPVFADCDPATGNIDPDHVEALVTDRTRGITLVHYLGIPCDMDAIMSIAGRHGLYVVEDCALAFGARLHGIHVGLFGDAGCFSFYPVKHLTTAEGGMLTTANEQIAALAAQKRAFGVDRTHDERAIPGMYDVTMLGMNARMSEMQAALGLAQMERADQMLARRAENHRILSEALDALEDVRVIAATLPDSRPSHYCLVAQLEGRLAPRRDDILLALRRAGVGFSVYYPHPVPRLAYYREKYGWTDGQYPRAAAISDASVALPVGPHLGPDEMHSIAGAFGNIVKEL
ncbi:DegT/DnrJ/EryC1/StrS family aminotransferase [Desulfobaculum sp. SPO524]|uniref:DegT/DnrJ/EryC1/StrS family aminotransferase n=1 Tax=Desulfobaculum sp. SPO524 TaxID=3378071 RepID=UPI003851928A